MYIYMYVYIQDMRTIKCDILFHQNKMLLTMLTHHKVKNCFLVSSSMF